MSRFIHIFVLLLFFATTYADDIGSDSIVAGVDMVMTAEADTAATAVVTDTLLKRPNVFKRIYRFMNKCFSPPRDPKYIDVQDYYNWCGMLQVTTRFEVCQLDADEKFLIRVSPRPRTRVGPFFGWRFAFFGYNIDLKSIFINSDDTDLSASIYSAAFGFDLFYRRVGGNYKIYKLVVNDVDISKYLRGEPFDGIHMGMTRVSFNYIFNYKHYSQQAAFSQTHRQLISAGSAIAGIQYAHNRSDINWQQLTDKMNAVSGTTLENSSLSGEQYNDEISLSGGYGYNWVFAKNWIFGVEATGSIGYLIQHTNNEYKPDADRSKFINDMEAVLRKNIALGVTTRFALLYNSGPIFTGLQGVSFYYQHGNGVMMSRDLIASVYALVGVNF
ncbi:MAG: DUF4421 domain-containing protein [Prevotella sp.]|nr:DUF4421 domain-containing protein [Prevotella sp.]